MLEAISALKGFAIEATDGRMGTVVDFLFDDASWKLRWLVVDCGSWLKGRKVLIHPSAVSYVALEDQQFDVQLTKAQVEGSPELLEHQPVSRRMESRLYDYYGWDPLWEEAPDLVPISGAMASPLSAPPWLGAQRRDEPSRDVDAAADDDHLRSVVEVIAWSERQVQLDVSRQQVEASPPWDPLVAFDEIYAKRLHEHYGWPGSRA
jgi:hypothetical protein